MRRLYGRTDYTEPGPFLYELEKDGIEIIGKVPYGFAPLRKTAFRPDGTAEFAHPLARRWARGVRLYHDDWGYGVITKTREDDEDNYVITVQFENGTEKRFLPKYQAHSLMIVSDD